MPHIPAHSIFPCSTAIINYVPLTGCFSNISVARSHPPPPWLGNARWIGSWELTHLWQQYFWQFLNESCCSREDYCWECSNLRYKWSAWLLIFVKLSILISQPLCDVCLVTNEYKSYKEEQAESITAPISCLRASVFFRIELWNSTPKSTDEVKGNSAHDVYRVLTLCHTHRIPLLQWKPEQVSSVCS